MHCECCEGERDAVDGSERRRLWSRRGMFFPRWENSTQDFDASLPGGMLRGRCWQSSPPNSRTRAIEKPREWLVMSGLQENRS